MTRRAAFDWIDALLFAFGFTSSIGLAIAFEVDVRRVALVLAFAPLGVRRLVFGPPPARELRAGGVWSLVSIAGLLLVLGGTGTLATAAAPFFDAAPPDFEAEARETYARVDAELASRVSFGLGARDEAPEARDARREAEIQAAAHQARAQWERHRAQRTSTAWKLAAVGLVLVTLGALLVRARQLPVTARS